MIHCGHHPLSHFMVLTLLTYAVLPPLPLFVVCLCPLSYAYLVLDTDTSGQHQTPHTLEACRQKSSAVSGLCFDIVCCG